MNSTIVGVLSPAGLEVFSDTDQAVHFLKEQEDPAAVEIADWIDTGKAYLPAKNGHWQIAYGEAEFCFK